MNLSALNYLAIFVSAFAAFIIGAIWFGPKTFYPIWVKELGQDPEARITKTSAPVLFGSTFLGMLAISFASAVVLQFVSAANGSVSLLDGLQVGLLLGVLVASAASLSHRLFAQQGFKVWIIEVGNDIVAAIAIGVILAVWR